MSRLSILVSVLIFSISAPVLAVGPKGDTKRNPIITPRKKDPFELQKVFKNLPHNAKDFIHKIEDKVAQKKIERDLAIAKREQAEKEKRFAKKLGITRFTAQQQAILKKEIPDFIRAFEEEKKLSKVTEDDFLGKFENFTFEQLQKAKDKLIKGMPVLNRVKAKALEDDKKKQPTGKVKTYQYDGDRYVCFGMPDKNITNLVQMHQKKTKSSESLSPALLKYLKIDDKSAAFRASQKDTLEARAGLSKLLSQDSGFLILPAGKTNPQLSCLVKAQRQGKPVYLYYWNKLLRNFSNENIYKTFKEGHEFATLAKQDLVFAIPHKGPEAPILSLSTKQTLLGGQTKELFALADAVWAKREATKKVKPRALPQPIKAAHPALTQTKKGVPVKGETLPVVKPTIAKSTVVKPAPQATVNAKQRKSVAKSPISEPSAPKRVKVGGAPRARIPAHGKRIKALNLKKTTKVAPRQTIQKPVLAKESPKVAPKIEVQKPVVRSATKKSALRRSEKKATPKKAVRKPVEKRELRKAVSKKTPLAKAALRRSDKKATPKKAVRKPVEKRELRKAVSRKATPRAKSLSHSHRGKGKRVSWGPLFRRYYLNQLANPGTQKHGFKTATTQKGVRKGYNRKAVSFGKRSSKPRVSSRSRNKSNTVSPLKKPARRSVGKQKRSPYGASKKRTHSSRRKRK